MNKRYLLIVAMLFALVLLVAPITNLKANDPGTQEQAIALVAADPRVAPYLEDIQGWHAAAYYTESYFGIWRVQFWNGDGETLVKGDVNVALGKVFWLEIAYILTEKQSQDGQRRILDFVSTHPEVRALFGAEFDQFEAYVYWADWIKMWAVTFYRGNEAVQVVVRSPQFSPLHFDNLELVGITFPNLLSVEEWHKSQMDKAISLAFANPQIAARLRDNSGWVSQAEATDQAGR